MLTKANVFVVPWIVNGFFKLITPFIDPLTRQKLKFNDDMRQHVPPQQLWNEFHGDLEFEYDHNIYWPALVKLCHEKQAEHYERWVKSGKQYGESELFIKGRDVPSITEDAPANHIAAIGAPAKETDNADLQPLQQGAPPQVTDDNAIVPGEKVQDGDMDEAPIQA